MVADVQPALAPEHNLSTARSVILSEPPVSGWNECNDAKGSSTEDSVIHNDLDHTVLPPELWLPVKTDPPLWCATGLSRASPHL